MRLSFKCVTDWSCRGSDNDGAVGYGISECDQPAKGRSLIRILSFFVHKFTLFHALMALSSNYTAFYVQASTGY